MSKPQKVNLYALPELKAALDEAIPHQITTLPPPYTFTQSHYLTTIRLALGYSAVLIAAALFYLDWTHGWDVTKPYTLPACILYFLLNGAMTLWIWTVESGTIFEGIRQPGGQRLKLASHIQKPRPEYVLHITYTNPDGSVVWQDNPVSVPFARLFNVHGYLQKGELQKWLSREVEVVGMADPKSKEAVMEWEREAGVGARGGSEMSGALKAVEEGDTIEVDVGGGSDGEVVATGRGAEASTPAKRGPGRPKKKV